MRVFVAAAIALAACGARTGLGPITESDAGAHADADADADASAPTCAASAPIAIAQTGGRPDAIVLDGAFVYWHDEHGVSRAPKAGGAAQLIAQTSTPLWPDLSRFAIGGDDVFYTDGVSFSHVAKGGGVPALVASGTELCVAASATHVYLCSASLKSILIFQLDFDGTGSTQIAQLPVSPNAMFITSTKAYAAADPGVYVLDLNGGATLLSGLTATDVAADDAHVYFTSNDPTNGARVIVLEPSTLATTKIDDTFGAFALALDAHDLYFTDSNSGRVRRIVGKIGPVSDIASTGQDFEPIDIALDDKCIYWSNAPRTSMDASGAIFAAPKP